MKKSLAGLVLILLGTGCAEFASIKNAVGFYGAQASDETLSTAIWTICKATPVGAITRRFQTAEQMGTWSDLCATVPEAPQ